MGKKIDIVQGGYGGWAARVGGTVASMVPNLETAKARAINLAISENETSVEVFDKNGNLIETLEVKKEG
ncbi:hypothetical protein [Spiroplasma culicicola]|uniref:Uncharacterized protein n=1 Tax=Spiroplasma culicicola AES-1 TaxID=1276246 RepID=W6A637_9MOLU|nr:hypothetical protein [Spiroplasma culicicola]AHI52583.1 hypothetical protein SCULI_v1c02420 [Spiroplasma culicicola AES-1]